MAVVFERQPAKHRARAESLMARSCGVGGGQRTWETERAEEVGGEGEREAEARSSAARHGAAPSRWVY